ncbi:hypothetical protein APHAL10511_001944 [Amanita phalloides]|nr:hypothetical protein APHAL10511_001944 [Amanita phalloides]
MPRVSDNSCCSGRGGELGKTVPFVEVKCDAIRMACITGNIIGLTVGRLNALPYIYTALLLCVAAVHAFSWTATPFNPAAIPLAVRSPYLSAWLPQGAGAALNDVWPTFWTGKILGWAGFVKVDGVAYSFLGAPVVPGATFKKATQQSFAFTATQSIFVLSAGPVDFTVTFLSPVEPNDLLKQSIPLSYLAVSAASTDGGSHHVQIYTDISAEWVSGDNSLVVTWSTSVGNVITHQIQLRKQTLFGELNDQTQYGSAYYSTVKSVGTTYQTAADTTARSQFIDTGYLSNTHDTNFRAVDNSWPVFALAQDVGLVTTSTAPVVFSIGHVRDPALTYIIAHDMARFRSIYSLNRFLTTEAMISSFIGDYSDALSRARSFDAKLRSDASAISSDYADIVALSVRQAFGAMEITVAKEVVNSSDVLIFLKEISSDGNVNTVDVIFPTWPILLYTNPILGKYLLEGLFRYQATGQYPNKWSVHDLGTHYPKALGHNDGADEPMPVEESGNMVIMALSYAQKSGDLSQLSKYYRLLDQWTQFLIRDSLIPGNQLSTDDFAGTLANQTNLAIKGIVGIKAMSQIARLVGDRTKASNYSSIAANYVNQWQSLATSSTGGHLTLSYGDSSSWGLSYNLYADKLLNLNLFPPSVYDMQTSWYKTVARPYGVPLDTRHTYSKSDWEIWTAAIMTDSTSRDLLIGSVWKWASDGLSSQPLGDWYETTNGQPELFRARPVIGGHFALLAL